MQAIERLDGSSLGSFFGLVRNSNSYQSKIVRLLVSGRPLAREKPAALLVVGGANALGAPAVGLPSSLLLRVHGLVISFFLIVFFSAFLIAINFFCVAVFVARFPVASC